MRAPRIAFYLHHGRWPEPFALHGCDNPRCCNAENPAHVHEGDQSLNRREMYARGRGPDFRGVRSGNARLTESQVAEIRHLYAARRCTQDELAARFGVHQTQISHIVLGQQWEKP